MHQHSADRREDHQQVKVTGNSREFAAKVAGFGGIDVHLGVRKVRVGARLTLAAGCDQVPRINRRGWIARRKKVMYAVAAGAGRGLARAHLRRQAVIAFEVRRRAATWDAELLRHAHAVMASRTGILGEVLGGHTRLRIARGQDCVYAVTVGARGSMEIARGEFLAMNGFFELSRFFLVTLCAGRWN